MVEAAPGLLVRLKFCVFNPVADVETWYEPASVLAVKVGAVAKPLALVVTMLDAAKDPVAPVDGTPNVKGIPAMGLP